MLFNVRVEICGKRLDGLRVKATRHRESVGSDVGVGRDDAETKAAVGELAEENSEEAGEDENYANYDYYDGGWGEVPGVGLK